MVPSERESRFATLHEVGRKLSSSLDLSVVLDNVMDSMIEVTGAERGFIMLMDGQGGLDVKVARNLDHQTIAADAFQISRTLTRRVAETGAPVVVTDALSDSSLGRAASVTAFQLRSILCAPLQVKGRTIGIVYVDNRLQSGQFTEADLELLVAFADQAATAIDNARLYDDAQQRMREIASMKEYQDNIFRSVGSALLTINLEGHVTTFNQAAERIFGTAAEAVIGRSHSHALGQELTAKLFRPIMRASRPGADPVGGLSLVCSVPGRDTAYLNVTVSGLRDPDGKSLGVVMVVDDETETRLAEEGRARAEAKQRMIRDVFGRYVADTVVERLLEDPSRVALGGERQEITVLFADIRGYTTLSEGLDPESVVALLNRYLAVGTRAIFEYEGTLDKYIGDAMMALFNTPLAQPDHAVAALRAALMMQRELKQLAVESDLPVAYGVGVNTGQAVVGNIGTERLMNYTAIGDAVNVAARLQSNAPPGEVLLTARTYELARGIVTVEALAPMHVKGRKEPVEVFRLLDVKGS